MQPLKEFINKNIVLFIIAITVFTIGIIGGSIISVNLSPKDSNELTQQLSGYISLDETGKLGFYDIFICECINHLRFVPLMFLFSLNLIFAVPGAVMLAVRGYQLGFSVSFVCSNFGKNGIFITLASAIFSYLVTVPIYIILFVLSVNCAVESNRLKGHGIRYGSLFILFLISYAILCMTAGIEGILLPIFIDFLVD